MLHPRLFKCRNKVSAPFVFLLSWKIKTNLIEHDQSNVCLVLPSECLKNLFPTRETLGIVSSAFQFSFHGMDLWDENEYHKVIPKPFLDEHILYVKIVKSEQIGKRDSECQKRVHVDVRILGYSSKKREDIKIWICVTSFKSHENWIQVDTPRV